MDTKKILRSYFVLNCELKLQNIFDVCEIENHK